jgi:hypothetical protein
VEAADPCKLGECLHDLLPIQEHRLACVREELRLALRHHGLPDGCPLCFEFICGREVQYVLVGHHQWAHNLQCEIFLLRRMAAGASYLFELGLKKAGLRDEFRLKSGWPLIRSETMFLLSLVKHSSDSWHIYALQTEPEQCWSFNVLRRISLEIDEMRRKEAERLEKLLALRLLKKVTEDAAKKAFKVKRSAFGQGRSRARGRGRGVRGRRCLPGGDDAADSATSESGDGSGESFQGVQDDADAENGNGVVEQGDAGEVDVPVLPQAAAPPPPHPVAPRPKRRSKAAQDYGNGGWELTDIRDSAGHVQGYGGNCRRHLDAGAQLLCKKAVTLGTSGLSIDVLRLRMKRWLVAGIDDDDWDQDTKRTKHVGMGGKFMVDFAEGLTEEQCDHIANSF